MKHEMIYRRRNSGAFTLIELTLALALVLVLTSIMVLNVGVYSEQQKLPEGAHRLRSVLHMARAEAASRQTRLRLEFSAEGQMQLSVETSPLAEPDVFEPFQADWASQVPTDLVRLASCRLAGSSAYRLAWRQDRSEQDAQSALESITFNPDGTCDDAVLDLCSASPADSRHAVITLDGLTAKASQPMLMTAQEYSESAGGAP